MSLQDESFPYDDFEISGSSGKNFVFPHHKPRGNVLTKRDNEVEDGQEILSASLQDKDESTQSSNGCCPPSETSDKTSTSEPNDLEEAGKKKSEYVRNNTNKSISYQDIHSESTKRRYKHVPSKVGQYIANIKAEDKKRRSSGKFQRHSSMPETLHGTETTIPELRNAAGILRHSINDLDRMHDGDNHELQSDHELENYDNLTATTSSSSTRDLGPDAGIFLDKHTYEQLLYRRDYLQTMLEEKNAENWRLKQNLEKMRIDYTMCKDKLNQQISQPQRLSGSCSSIGGTASLGRNSLQCLLYAQETKEKSTQTERLLTPSPAPPALLNTNSVMFATPLTPDSNNNSFDHAAVGMMAPAAHKVPKHIATIQPLSINFSNIAEQDSRDFNSSNIDNTMGYLRQRSNSIAARKKSTPLPMNISKVSSVGSSMPSSSDSAIDIEITGSPKSQRQCRREEFDYYDNRAQRFAVLETRNAERSYTDININSSSEITMGAMSNDDRRVVRKRHNLRSRMMRFFGSCAKCDDPNMSVDSRGNSQQKSFSQIPLLEKSSKNTCSNVR